MDDKEFSNAAFNNNIAALEDFIELGYKGINKKNASGLTPLMVAVIEAHPEVVKLLLKHGANISIRNNDNETALDIAKNHRLEDYTVNFGNLFYLRDYSEEIIDLLEKAEKKRERLSYVAMITQDRSSFSRFSHDLVGLLGVGDVSADETDMIRTLFDQAPPDVILEIIMNLKKVGGTRTLRKQRTRKRSKKSRSKIR
jgi:hypothetical protein